MKIIIPSVQVPFITGGAEMHTNNLCHHLKRRGHEVEILRFPFAFFPESVIEGCMDFSANLDLTTFNGHPIDRVIALQFPAYYVRHPRKIIWLTHQHRAVYEFFDPERSSGTLRRLRDKIIACDTVRLGEAEKRFTISRNVSRRLANNNHLDSAPLYHPPPGAGKLYCKAPFDYIFYPSRVEKLKRQDLLVEAMAYTQSPVVAIIVGEGGQKEAIRALIEQRCLVHKVRLMDFIRPGEIDLLHNLYARCLGVFFGPFDEDYGYVTLEAMLSCKPIITCSDAGGPLEFVVDGDNGLIAEPNPRAIAEKIDWLYEHKQKAIAMGRCGFDTYQQNRISWDNVIDTLLGD